MTVGRKKNRNVIELKTMSRHSIDGVIDHGRDDGQGRPHRHAGTQR
jgi:hypothetical protein